jgi:hypothetical protein
VLVQAPGGLFQVFLEVYEVVEHRLPAAVVGWNNRAESDRSKLWVGNPILPH